MGSPIHPTDGGWYRRLAVPTDPFSKRKHAISDLPPVRQASKPERCCESKTRGWYPRAPLCSRTLQKLSAGSGLDARLQHVGIVQFFPDRLPGRSELDLSDHRHRHEDSPSLREQVPSVNCGPARTRGPCTWTRRPISARGKRRRRRPEPLPAPS
jgi:hypothetical protein